MLSVFSHHEIAYQNCFEIASYTFGNGWDHFPLSLDSLVPKEKVWEHGKTLTFTKAMWIHSLFLNGFHLILSFHVLFTIFNIIYISVLYGTLSTSFWIPCALFLHFHPAKMQWLGDAKSLTVHSWTWSAMFLYLSPVMQLPVFELTRTQEKRLALR